MGPGSGVLSTDMFGSRMFRKVLRHIPPTDIGCLPTKGGLGFRIIHGDGRHSIMDDGMSTRIGARSGFLITSGDQAG